MTDGACVRTDLALEETERFASDQVEISGVILEEIFDKTDEIKVTRVQVKTENGARAMGKPVGVYVTLETPNLAEPDIGYHRLISEKLAAYLLELLEGKGLFGRETSVLVVGLGNRQITPDALGPYVADQLCVTRHLVKEYGKYALEAARGGTVSAIAPGVMGQTGMETAEILRGIVGETKPDVMIAVDALAARNSKRLNRTIQLADTGIHPGSGMGNYRSGITEETVGVPVIGVGVPTVVEAAAIVSDTLENLLMQGKSYKALFSGHGAEKQELIREMISPHLQGMFVTLKNEDELVKQMSFTISEGLNLLFTSGEGGEGRHPAREA